MFDYVVTVVGTLDAGLYLARECHATDSAFLRFVRSLRVLRLLRLVALSKGCEVIVLTCTFAWPRLVTVCQLLVILIFFFANVGAVLFGDYDPVARYANFESEVRTTGYVYGAVRYRDPSRDMLPTSNLRRGG